MQLQANLIDLDRVFKAIDGLKDIDKDKVIKQGLRTATAVFVNAGRVNLRARMKNKNGTGNLMKSFVNKVKRNKLGSLAGFSGLGGAAHLVDLGTEDRYTKAGKYTGSVKGNNFWTDAITSNEGKAIDKVYEGIERGITKLIMRN